MRGRLPWSRLPCRETVRSKAVPQPDSYERTQFGRPGAVYRPPLSLRHESGFGLAWVVCHQVWHGDGPAGFLLQAEQAGMGQSGHRVQPQWVGLRLVCLSMAGADEPGHLR